MSEKKNIKKDDLLMEIEALHAKNAALEMDNGDLRESLKRMESAVVQMEDRYDAERKARREVSHAKFLLEEDVSKLTTQLQAAKALRSVEHSKRHGSIPKFVIVAAIALVVLMGSFLLQKLCAIGPSVGYGIQCGMSMVIAWCYAIIWDRSRK